MLAQPTAKTIIHFSGEATNPHFVQDKLAIVQF